MYDWENCTPLLLGCEHPIIEITMNKCLSIQEFTDNPDSYQLIDVRSATEYATGHIPGAINIPLEQVESRIGDLAKNRPVVLTCQSGQRAKIAAGLLASAGSGVLLLEGSTSGWSSSGHPLIGSVPARWSLERQVRLIAGLLVVLALLLSVTVGHAWMLLAGFVGLGLMFAGLTNICGMGILLAKMPWNKASNGKVGTAQSCPR